MYDQKVGIETMREQVFAHFPVFFFLSLVLLILSYFFLGLQFYALASIDVKIPLCSLSCILHLCSLIFYCDLGIFELFVLSYFR